MKLDIDARRLSKFLISLTRDNIESIKIDNQIVDCSVTADDYRRDVEMYESEL